MSFENIVSAYNYFVEYHDDMLVEKGGIVGRDAEVEVLPFPYMDLFGDFRVFNGIKLAQMDEFLGRIRKIMIEIANIHAQNEREEYLKEQKKEVKTE